MLSVHSPAEVRRVGSAPPTSSPARYVRAYPAAPQTRSQRHLVIASLLRCPRIATEGLDA